ncbi:ABC transporter substrate-binding protein [Sediminibacillus terrae]|uniref:ABC transporter substrate-binding protein n=1 Tax=Sediminibacillus terrae TaxID=1562106 RepID=UPI001295D683|nr:ABC transporter substrate-binding protein [Sediminibacillus terrae]
MRKTVAVWLSILALVVLAACGDSASGSGEGGDGKGSSDKLTVYSPHQTEIINPIIKEFQDRTDIEVELVTGGTGELLNRIEAEAGNPLGDVMWGGGAESLQAYSDQFETYEVAESDQIPDMYKSPDSSWVGFSALPMVIMYNKDLVEEADAPKTWQDLLDQKWKGKIAYADPAKSGSSYTQLVTMLEANKDDGNDGWDFVADFVENLDGKILSGSSMVYKGVADGEFPIGVTLEEAAYRYVSGGANVDVAYPEEGTSAVPDGAALIKDAKNKDNAQEFLDFLTSKDVQELTVSEFNRRSVREDVEPPEGLTTTDEIPFVDYDFDWASENQEAVMGKFQDLIIGK